MAPAQPSPTEVTTDPAPAVTPAVTPSRGTNFGVAQVYANPAYQPYVFPQGSPYSYQQYSSAYYPPSYYNATTAGPPVTIQRYVQQFPMSAVNVPGQLNTRPTGPTGGLGAGARP